VIKPEISIIIVNYNVRDFLINALNSLKKSLRDITNEIIVVDNNSLDDSVKSVEQLFPEVIIIKSKQNLGFAKANNLALKRCTGKFILLLNPDTIVGEDTIEKMLQFFNQNPDAGIAGCKILNSDGTLQLPCRRSFPTPWVSFTKLIGLSKLFPKTKIFGKYNITYLDPDQTYEVEAISGSFMFLRREVYEDIGGLDEQFFMYGEDLDWLYRAYINKWKIFYVHNTQIIHYKGESTKRSDIDAITRFYEAMHIFVKKHYKSPSLLVPILRAGIFFRSLIAFLGRIWRNNFGLLIDFVLIIGLIFFSEYLRFGKFYNFPVYAYPIVFIIPAFVFISTLFSFGVYHRYKLSLSRTLLAIILSFLILSSLTYFFKDYAFSRKVLLIMNVISLAVLPGWRMIFSLFVKTNISIFPFHNKRLLGKKTLIVGFDEKDNNFISKIKTDYINDYNVLGLLVKDPIQDKQVLKDIPVLGPIYALEGIVKKYNVEEVIFSTRNLAYTEILSLISNCRAKRTNFKLIPHDSNVLESSRFSSVDTIDLVEIDLKINKIFNKLTKRVFDFLFALFLIILLVPLNILLLNRNQGLRSFLSNLLKILLGKLSVIGICSVENYKNENLKLGRYGLTGLAEINLREDASSEEKLKFNIIYAKNQSLLLDLEILFRALIKYFRKK
jgi:O-antigen biosynthesis protein